MENVFCLIGNKAEKEYMEKIRLFG